MVTNSPSFVYRGNPPSAVHTPNPVEIVTLLDEILASVDIALGDRTKPYFLVVDGQSDIDDEQAAQAGGDIAPDARIRVQTPTGWQMMDPANGIGNKLGRNSIGFQTSKQLLRMGYPMVYLVDLGTAGRPIEDWMGDGKDSELYVLLKTAVETALASLELIAAGITEISGFGWAQGGSNNMDSFEDYKEKIRTLFIDLLPTESWFSLRTPVAMQDLGMATGFNKMDGVITQDMMAEFPYILVHRTNDLARDYPGDGGNHQTGEDMDESGRRMAMNLLVPRPALPFTDKSIVFGDFTLWGQPFFGNGAKFHYDVATGQFRMAAFNGTTLSATNFFGFDYEVPGAARVLLSSSVAIDLLGPAVSVQGNMFFADVLRMSELGHVRTGEFTEAQLDNPADPVNTHDGKGRGALVTNITDQALVRSSGSGDASGWYGTYPDYFLTPGGEKVPLAPMADGQPATFEALDGFRAWAAAPPAPVPDGAVAFASGKEFIKDSTAGSLGAYINNWKAPDGILTTNHIGTSSEIASDFKSIAEELMDAAMNKDYVAYFEVPPDGSPFEYTYFRPTISGKVLRVRGDRNAEFYPVENFQTFATDGSQTVFAHDPLVWNWEGPAEGYGAEFIAPNGTDRTKLVFGTDINDPDVDIVITDSGGGVYTFEARDPNNPGIPGGVLPDGGTLKIVAARSAFDCNAAPGSGAELHWDGFFRFNVSRGGVAVASGGRSGFAHTGVDHIFHGGFIHTYGTALTGPGAAPINQRGDSNYVPIGFLTMQGNGTVIGDWCNDVAGIYVSGGPTQTGETDDPIYCQLPKIVARNSGLVLKDTRKMQSGYAPSVIGLDCKNFYVNAAQEGFPQGENFTLGYARSVRTERRIVDIRDNNGLITINDLSIEDFGMSADGVTPTTGARGIFLQGAKGVTCNFRATRRRWDAPTAALVIFEGDECQGNRIQGVAQGYDYLVENSVNDTLAAGNSVDIRHDGATTLYSSGAFDNIRRKFTNTVTNEVVEKRVFPVVNTSPTFLIAGPSGSPAIVMSTDPDPVLSDTKIEKRLDGDMMDFTLVAEGTITHAETAKDLRVVLDFEVDNTLGMQMPVTVARSSGITAPAGAVHLYGSIDDEAAQIKLYWKLASGGRVIVSTDHITTGANVTVQVSGRVPVAG